MLIGADPSQRTYHIALNNATSVAELMADFSYLENVPPTSTLILDFRHMAAPLTQEQRLDYMPGGFGYQPVLHLMEIIAAISSYLDARPTALTSIRAMLPTDNSRIGRFLADMRVPEVLQEQGCVLVYTTPASAERGEDDLTRQNLIPITVVNVSGGRPDFVTVRRIRTRVERVFASGLPDMDEDALPADLANTFTSVVSEAVDNMIEYGGGGIIGGLYYRRVGEVEITLVNRRGGFGGATPKDQLESLIDACEGLTRRSEGGGNGIRALTELATVCFGTLLFRNGSAYLRFEPNGEVIGNTDDLGIVAPGASVTLLLQLIPTSSAPQTDMLRAYETVLRKALRAHVEKRPQI